MDFTHSIYDIPEPLKLNFNMKSSYQKEVEVGIRDQKFKIQEFIKATNNSGLSKEEMKNYDMKKFEKDFKLTA